MQRPALSLARVARVNGLSRAPFRALQHASRQPLRMTGGGWRLVGLGSAGMIGGWVVYNYAMEGRLMQVVHAEGPVPPSPTKEAIDPNVRIDPATSLSFPIHLSPSSTPSGPLTLVGIGVRKVSFLRVKVYSAGFYLEEEVLKRLQGVEGWHNFTEKQLLTPPADQDSPQLSGEKLMEKLIGGPVSCAIRIVPSRNTDFGHLRDGFTRALLARQKMALRAATITPADEERIAKSIQTFKSFFPTSTVPKGRELLLLKTSDGCLAVEYEGKQLGKLKDDWVATEMMVAYFADKNVISEALKEDVAAGFEKVMRR